MRIGFFRDLPRRISVSPAQRGRWFNLPDGSQVWSLVLESPGAEGIRLRLANLNVPPGVQFMVFDATQPTMTYEYHTSTDSSGTTTFWTETTFSSKVALEFVVPPGVDASQLRFDIDRIVHVYVKLGDWGMPKEGNCHNDVTCYPAYTTQAAGVAGIGSIGEGGFLFCTGCLLADGDPATVVNYFMTANHCVANSSEASTLEFYWFFQTSSCNGSPPDPEDVPRTTGGADYLAGATRDAGSDFAFLRMKQSPPGGVAYEGWSTAQLAANEAIAGIHHPDGTFKRISFGNFVKYAGNFTDVRWSSGVTEPGSSGSPLFNNAKLFVGQLYGGQSYCWRQNGIDEYGRFDITFPIIKQYLSVNPPARMLYYDDPRDFDGDGMADLAIYHPPQATWYFKHSTGSNVTKKFGFSPTAQFVGDFDGDNRTDYGVYYAPGGNWYILSASNVLTTAAFGYKGTVPVPGDYDGDGKTDMAVFDDRDGSWHQRRTTAGYTNRHFGYRGVIPLPFDYDGDGRTDMCVFDTNNATWYVQRTTEGLLTTKFGYSKVIPAPADYNGDGRTDIAIFDSLTANWYARLSSTNITNVTFGSLGGFAVPADYDGDGIDDMATYRLSTGTWLIRKSTGGVQTNNFGWSAAPPVGIRP
jgi:hypothetical protein